MVHRSAGSAFFEHEAELKQALEQETELSVALTRFLEGERPTA